MVGKLKNLSDTTFTIQDIIPGYRIERIGNAYFLKANAHIDIFDVCISKIWKIIIFKKFNMWH